MSIFMIKTKLLSNKYIDLIMCLKITDNDDAVSLQVTFLSFILEPLYH